MSAARPYECLSDHATLSFNLTKIIEIKFLVIQVVLVGNSQPPKLNTCRLTFGSYFDKVKIIGHINRTSATVFIVCRSLVLTS